MNRTPHAQRGSPPQTQHERAVPRVRRRLEVRGTVQGVGFRPFVFRLAGELGLGGFVANDRRGAFIEVEGPAEALETFARRLREERPPLARIDAVTQTELPPKGQTAFGIQTSEDAGAQQAHITPDAATCEDCLRELFDPADRRYRYPFINCTNCGPRYSIIQAVPYDRPNTTMAAFAMCAACQAEYDDPSDRRFHAQPNACPACGPRVWLVDAGGEPIDGDPVARAAELLLAGRIVAIKGLGGFHLACRADSDQAVRTLRRRKGRESKPLAVMVGSMEQAGACAVIDEAAATAMQSPARPIVLAPRRPDAPVSGDVAGDCDTLGIMLAYTPLHALLFAESLPVLVMTSGNPSDEPLCRDNGEALARLSGVAEAFLLHDRDIERRVDDSVVLPVQPAHPGPGWCFPIRRSRGYVPSPIVAPAEAARPVLAVGGELKSTVCLLAGRQAVLSEHLGELPHPATYRNFLGTVELFQWLLRLEPALLACDLHPAYVTTRWARGTGLPVRAVQHHHAHVVACLADNGLTGRVIGIAVDGTGYGSDGAVWGGEVLVADEADFVRAAHVRYYPLVGADAAAIETWRPAAGLLHEALGPNWTTAARAFQRVEPEALALSAARLAGNARLPATSSLGRLFDAAAFLLGLCDRNHHEGQAAMALEAAAHRGPPGTGPLDYAITQDADGMLLLDFRPAMAHLASHAAEGPASDALARAFHETLSAGLAEAATRIAGQTGLDRVCLTGGCMVNRLLLAGLWTRLSQAGLSVFAHRQVPPGDGGLALGQAVSAAARG